MIICAECKHGKGKYCQSDYAIGLTQEQKRTVYSSCAFFEQDEANGKEVLDSSKELDLF
jgi:hypothetical protein